MAKQHNIRWRKSDYSKLSHTIRKFNKKAFTLEVTRPDLSGNIPDLLDYKTVKSGIKTRADLNRFIKKHERFLREGAEELHKSTRGAVMTQWEKHEFEIAQNVENMRRAKRKKRIDKMKVTQGGKDTGVTRAEMGSIKENEVKPSKKNVDNMSQKEWDAARKLFDKKLRSDYNEEKTRAMKSNYILGLIRAGYSQEIIDLVSRVPLETFLDIVDTDVYAEFDFIYDPQELKDKEELLNETWKDYATEKDSNVDLHEIKQKSYEELWGVKK